MWFKLLSFRRIDCFSVFSDLKAVFNHLSVIKMSKYKISCATWYLNIQPPCQCWHPKLVCSDMNFSRVWLQAAGVHAPKKWSCSWHRQQWGTNSSVCDACVHIQWPHHQCQKIKCNYKFSPVSQELSYRHFSQNSTHTWVSAAQWSCELCCLSRMCLLISASAQLTDSLAKQKYRCLSNWVVLSLLNTHFLIGKSS